MDDSFESIFIAQNRTVNTTLAFDAAMDILTDFDQSNLGVSDDNWFEQLNNTKHQK